jgi:excisionase family DNA binding protein
MKDLQLIRPSELCDLLSISIATLYRWEAQGKLPIKKVKVGPGVVGFKKSDVEAWIKESQDSD